VLIHITIEAEAGGAAGVARRLKRVRDLDLRGLEGEDRLVGTLPVGESCPVADVVRLFTADPAVRRVHHLVSQRD